MEIATSVTKLALSEGEREKNWRAPLPRGMTVGPLNNTYLIRWFSMTVCCLKGKKIEENFVCSHFRLAVGVTIVFGKHKGLIKL